MALIATTGPVPKNAIELTASEAALYQWKQIMSWPDVSDVWPFKFGIAGLGILAAATGMIINKHYRVKLKLRQYGYGSTIIPMTVAPALFSAVLHNHAITVDIFLRRTKCPVCLQYRASCIQLGCSVVYPLLLSPLANFMFADRHGTYRVPYWKNHRETFNLWLKLTRPFGKKLLLLSVIHVLAAGFITYAEGESFYKIQMKLLQDEENYFNEQTPSLKT